MQPSKNKQRNNVKQAVLFWLTILFIIAAFWAAVTFGALYGPGNCYDNPNMIGCGGAK